MNRIFRFDRWHWLPLAVLGLVLAALIPPSPGQASRSHRNTMHRQAAHRFSHPRFMLLSRRIATLDGEERR
jgi:hypothetical protein